MVGEQGPNPEQDESESLTGSMPLGQAAAHKMRDAPAPPLDCGVARKTPEEESQPLNTREDTYISLFQ
ncbi:hypothetical protein HRR83_004204 [Exophiala dermatitidis]|uniref:Uncharacterized protein n=1 Tax=Exophiala dermatitidis TaxID=5970 RepID=A0AAN6IUU1_EXODE|nr:hypothetical protein HRR73_006334 [Exophiala dermatitidis]KAJ4521491.1 hypothetical protein HRR74_003315 [Exophiala dermatitidis]KAJ4542165.1 hypothetical protein HRR77_006050 [Exophiala dermatitidis]KAJ4544931.1 hypothetical protein HRR76_002967 [Exophiala dermatitidis]KAJ4565405.1 hypothetical protein HRR79_005668 [Exophiala dermatitidis]